MDKDQALFRNCTIIAFAGLTFAGAGSVIMARVLGSLGILYCAIILLCTITYRRNKDFWGKVHGSKSVSKNDRVVVKSYPDLYSVATELYNISLPFIFAWSVIMISGVLTTLVLKIL